MRPNLLVLGGTLEATALSTRLAACDVRATLSLAGRVSTPKQQSLPMRVGGFGGVEGFRRYLIGEEITHVVDATHPFASRMSHTAATICAALDIPLVALTREAWKATSDDNWRPVPDLLAAAVALDVPARRVFLAVGRMHLDTFAVASHHHYVLRLVDPPDGPLPLPDATVLVERGPFSFAHDLELLRQHRVDLVVSKNSGGRGAVAKIEAARKLKLPVIMINRPAPPDRVDVHSVDAALRFLVDHGADLGV